MLDIRIPFSSQTEDKSIIKSQMGKWWQEHWDTNNTDKNHLNIQKREDLDQKEEGVITCLRIRHTGLNQLLNEIGKHPTGRCVHCKQSESGKHVLFECRGYEEERRVLASLIKGAKVSFKSQKHINTWYNFEGNRTNGILYFNHLIDWINSDTQCFENVLVFLWWLADPNEIFNLEWKSAESV